jgi:hypothetical protein
LQKPQFILKPFTNRVRYSYYNSKDGHHAMAVAEGHAH